MSTRNFIRIATCVPKIEVGRPELNYTSILGTLDTLTKDNPDIRVIALPELCFTGQSCKDLFLSEDLIYKTVYWIKELMSTTKFPRHIAVIIGAPCPGTNGKLYDCLYVLNNTNTFTQDKKIYVIPKQNLEPEQKRWFSDDIENFIPEPKNFEVIKNGLVKIDNVTLGITFDNNDVKEKSKQGANVVIVSTATMNGKLELENQLKYQSGQENCGLVFVSAGPWESQPYPGYTGIFECGEKLDSNSATTKTLGRGKPYGLVQDLDLNIINAHRKNINTQPKQIQDLGITFTNTTEMGLTSNLRSYPKFPFLKEKNYPGILKKQILGLQKRILATGGKCVIGISGGADSTWALIVTYLAVRDLGMDTKTHVIGVTMPGPGTTEKTKNLAHKLMEVLEIDAREINITELTNQTLAAISHPADNYNTTFENVQARIRTNILLNLANKENGIVIGTGNMSESMLGWCTFGGDQLSSYNPNAEIPKTLLIELLKQQSALVKLENPDKTMELEEIIDAVTNIPVSPELIPGGKQKSEELVGPFELCDYFIYYLIFNNGLDVKKIIELTLAAWKDKYNAEEIKKWFIIFLKKLGTSQFKRSCSGQGINLQLPDDITLGTLITSAETYYPKP